jgi:hypothetical protein
MGAYQGMRALTTHSLTHKLASAGFEDEVSLLYRPTLKIDQSSKGAVVSIVHMMRSELRVHDSAKQHRVAPHRRHPTWHCYVQFVSQLENLS